MHMHGYSANSRDLRAPLNRQAGPLPCMNFPWKYSHGPQLVCQPEIVVVFVLRSRAYLLPIMTTLEGCQGKLV